MYKKCSPQPANEAGRTSMNTPFFSIITPAYNRAHVMERTIKSVLNQTDDDFEYIIVDDGSTDGTCEVVQRFTDPRIKLIIHPENRGIGPTRNTGFAAASGEWLVPHDSDDELVPEALAIARKRIQECDDSIRRIRFNVQWDNGKITPDPPLIDEIWNYERYLQELNGKRGCQETSSVYHRATFAKVKWAKYKAYTGEMHFHLNFFKHFNVRTVPDAIRLYHTDSGNQQNAKETVKGLLRKAHDRADQAEVILAEHGEALLRYAPRIHRMVTRSAILQNNFAGSKLKAMQYLLKAKSISAAQKGALLGLITLPPSLASLAYLKLKQARKR